MTAAVPADIVALLPTTVHAGFDDFADPDDDCYFAHDDVRLTDEVRQRVEQAAWAAGLIGHART